MPCPHIKTASQLQINSTALHIRSYGDTRPGRDSPRNCLRLNYGACRQKTVLLNLIDGQKEKEKWDCISGNDVFDNTYTHCMSLYCSNVKCGWNVPRRGGITQCELGRVQTRADVVDPCWCWPVNSGQQTKMDWYQNTWPGLRVHCVYEFFGNLIHHRYVSATEFRQALLCECILPPYSKTLKPTGQSRQTACEKGLSVSHNPRKRALTPDLYLFTPVTCQKSRRAALIGSIIPSRLRWALNPPT